MQTYTSFEALRVIEALRSGIPSRLVAKAFNQAREGILNQVEGLMQGIKENQISDGFAFQAQYGNGKSHLLSQIFELAWKKNFVVSTVVLNKETPLCNLNVLYQKAAQSSFLPGHELPGFDRELFQMKIKDEKVADLLHYAQQHLHPRFKAIFQICLNENEESQQLFYGDLLGNIAGISTIKSSYRFEFKKPVKIPGFKKGNPDEMMDYFRFLSMLFKAMGYAGWVILFDEAELIERHAPKSRIKAYLNLYRLMDMGKSKVFPMLSVFAFASTFETFINEKNDLEVLPEKALEDGARVKKIIKHLMEIQNLDDFSTADLIKIAQEVKKLHGLAFQWSPDINLNEIINVGTVERRIRTMVRAVIQSLDLACLGRPHDLEISRIDEKPMEENEGFFSVSTDDI